MANKQIRLNQIQQDGATDGQVIKWNNSLTKWEPGTASVTPAALSEVDDTNVTLSLGGTPSTALLQAVTITAGWNGTLAVGRGGIGTNTLTGVAIGNGTSAFTAVTGTANQLLRRNGTNTAYEFFTPTYLTANQSITLSSDVTGTGTTAITTTISNNAVTYAKMQDVTATNRFIGRITAGAGDPEELTGTQATSLLDLFSTTTTTKGLVPGSNNAGTSSFLRADGTWAVPPAGGTPAGSTFQVQYHDTGAVFGADANFNYDPANDRLVVGTTIATATMHARGPNDSTAVLFRGENLTGNNIFNILASGHWQFGDNEVYPRFYQSATTGGAVGYTTNGITADVSFLATGDDDGFGVNHPSLTASSGTKRVLKSTGTWAPTSGAATYYSISASPTINHTSTYTGISVGLGITPTLTGLTVGKFYGIYMDANNTNAYGIYQSGTSSYNYFGGKVGFGSTVTAAYALDIGATTAIRIPIGTGAQQPAAAAGLLRYNSDDAKLEYSTASAWVQVGAGGATDHGTLSGLLDDDHTQYALLDGRSTTQTLNGGSTAAGSLQLRGTINATPGNVIINGAGGDIQLGGGTSASELRFMEPSGSGSDYTAFKAQAQSGSVVYTLPAAAPTTSGQILSSTTGGTLSWLLDRATYAELNTQSGTTYTLILSDAGKMIDCTSTTAVTFTIPTNASVAFPVGTLIHVTQSNTGQITFGGSGVTINSADGKLKTRVRYSTVTLQKMATDTWLLYGDITT